VSLPRDPQTLAAGVLQGDVRAVARAITLVENGHADKAALLRALRDTIETGRGRLITVVAEAGVGKSRLVREFSRRLEALPVKMALFQGRTDQRLMEVPYGLLRDLVVDHFRIEEGDRGRQIEDKLTRNLAEALRLLAERPEVLNRLLRLPGLAKWPMRYLMRHPGVRLLVMRGQSGWASSSAGKSPRSPLPPPLCHCASSPSSTSR